MSGNSSTATAPALAIHGGAWAIPDDAVEDHLDAMRRALAVGKALLSQGRGALEVVVAVVRTLEDHPALDAGVGAVLNRAGEVQLDAGVMDGSSGDYGAVAGARRILHPIEAARAVLEQGGRQVSLIVADGADRWAQAHGLEMVDPSFFVVPREQARFEKLREAARFHTSEVFKDDRPRGTVGCAALDAQGRIASGTSTGGTPYSEPGRVGDSPLPGCGFWANAAAGASATGWGEAIARVLMSAHAVEGVEQGLSVQAAAERAVARLGERVKDPSGAPAGGGVILVDRLGEVGLAFNTPRMARAAWSPRRGESVDCD